MSDTESRLIEAVRQAYEAERAFQARSSFYGTSLSIAQSEIRRWVETTPRETPFHLNSTIQSRVEAAHEAYADMTDARAPMERAWRALEKVVRTEAAL